MQKMVISIGGDEIKEVQLMKERTSLGRRPYNDIVIENLSVSSVFFQAEDGIRDLTVTGVQTCALPICWLSPHRTGDCPRLRHRYRQRHRPPGARETLSTRSRNRWPVLAELYRTYEGQPVVCRSVPLRIDTPAQPLGHGGDGRVHTPDHWLWR